MKRIFLLIMAIFYFSFCPSSLWAASRSVTITWLMNDTTGVEGYKVYYADNSAMTSKIWLSNCDIPIENPARTFTITCNDVTIANDQTYYFTVVAVMADDSETSSNPHEAIVTTTPITIRKVENFMIVPPK